MTASRETLTQDLPTLLPDGEAPLWRGGPAGHLLAVQALHVRKVAIYFAALLAWREFLILRDGYDVALATNAALTTLAMGAIVVAALYGYAVWSAKNTSYTITSERIVIRTGVALSVTINIPFSKIADVDLRHTQARRQPTAGDLLLSLADDAKVSYIVLWLNARPLRFFRTQPMLRALSNVDTVAQVLSDALRAHAQRHDLPVAAADASKPGASRDNEDHADLSLVTS